MTQLPFNNVGAKKSGFWTRQFAPIPTPAQDTFDSVFAILLPIMFLVVDPIVFKSSAKFLGPGYLEDYQLLAYIFCSLEIGLFLTWRTFRLPLRRFSMVFAGAFFAGAAFSTVIGIVILPLSILGLMAVVGLLGLTPFLTAFVFLRNSVRAARININGASVNFRCATFILCGVLVIGMPLIVQMKMDSDVSAAVDTLISGTAPEAAAAAQRLKTFHFISRRHCNEISAAYTYESNLDRKAILDQAYRDITGEEPGWRYR